MDWIRRFGGGVLLGEGAYWSGRSGEVDAWLKYHAGEENGSPNLLIDGSCADSHRPELLERLDG